MGCHRSLTWSTISTSISKYVLLQISMPCCMIVRLASAQQCLFEAFSEGKPKCLEMNPSWWQLVGYVMSHTCTLIGVEPYMSVSWWIPEYHKVSIRQDMNHAHCSESECLTSRSSRTLVGTWRCKKVCSYMYDIPNVLMSLWVTTTANTIIKMVR